MTQETQEGRTERLTVAVTPYEHHAAHWLAKTLEGMGELSGGVSVLLRRMSVDDAVARYDEMMARLRDPAEGKAA